MLITKISLLKEIFFLRKWPIAKSHVILILSFKNRVTRDLLHLHTWASAAGAGGACPSWIFIHGTNIVDRTLKCYFSVFFLLYFGLFFLYLPLTGRGFIVLFFGLFCLPPESFCQHPCLRIYYTKVSIPI